MTDLYYQHQWDSPELKQAAADCGITPSGWIRPGGEDKSPADRWWFGTHIDAEKLTEAIRWRLDWMGFTGPVWEYEGPLIINLEGFTQAYKPDDPAFGPRTWVETRREVQRQCRLIAPKAKWCEYGLPSSMHQWGDVPFDLNGVQYLGVVQRGWDYAAPSCYWKGENGLPRIEQKLLNAQAFGQPIYAYVSPRRYKPERVDLDCFARSLEAVAATPGVVAVEAWCGGTPEDECVAAFKMMAGLMHA